MHWQDVSLLRYPQDGTLHATALVTALRARMLVQAIAAAEQYAAFRGFLTCGVLKACSCSGVETGWTCRSCVVILALLDSLHYGLMGVTRCPCSLFAPAS